MGAAPLETHPRLGLRAVVAEAKIAPASSLRLSSSPARLVSVAAESRATTTRCIRGAAFGHEDVGLLRDAAGKPGDL